MSATAGYYRYDGSTAHVHTDYLTHGISSFFSLSNSMNFEVQQFYRSSYSSPFYLIKFHVNLVTERHLEPTLVTCVSLSSISQRNGGLHFNTFLDSFSLALVLSDSVACIFHFVLVHPEIVG